MWHWGQVVFFHDVKHDAVNDGQFQDEDFEWRKCTIIAKNWHYCRRIAMLISLKSFLKGMCFEFFFLSPNNVFDIRILSILYKEKSYFYYSLVKLSERIMFCACIYISVLANQWISVKSAKSNKVQKHVCALESNKWFFSSEIDSIIEKGNALRCDHWIDV